MDITINFESSVPRSVVVLHAWEPQGKVWDVSRRDPTGNQFRFRIEGAIADQRTVQFKFRFPDEHRWEANDFLRTIPTRRVKEFWCYDGSPRVRLHPPGQTAPGHLAVQLLTRARFAGGSLYAWNPATGDHAWFPQSSRRDADGVSSFLVVVSRWMQAGFHFKFVDAAGRFESDACNRVWRPADGEAISVKSGQSTLWSGPPDAKKVTITLLYPKQLTAPPALLVADESGDPHVETVCASAPGEPSQQDPRFSRASYQASVYPEASYSVQIADRTLEGDLTRPLRVAPEDTGAELEKLAMLGDSRWLAENPARAPVSLVFHSRPWTPQLAQLSFHVAIGSGAAFDRVAAHRATDGTWRAELRAPVGMTLSVTPTADQPLDQRQDGPISTKRTLTLADVAPVELHTADAQPGFLIRRGAAAIATQGETS
jgi:hypothetical protein